jgi:tRNA1(Val) A37 N6-methylase TrmN6
LESRFGDARLRAVQPKAEEPAIRILVTAVKGSRGPLALCPPLVLHGPDGRFTDEGAVLHGGSD